MYYKLNLGTLEDWDTWEAAMRKRHPYQFFIKEIVPREIRFQYQKVHDFFYYVKCLLFKRYNVVRCRRLPPTWIDKDHLMLHCCFQLLEDFIEKEEPWEATASFNELVKTYGSATAFAWTQIQDLYHWWKLQDLEDSQEMLERLIIVRGHLWT